MSASEEPAVVVVPTRQPDTNHPVRTFPCCLATKQGRFIAPAAAADRRIELWVRHTQESLATCVQSVLFKKYAATMHESQPIMITGKKKRNPSIKVNTTQAGSRLPAKKWHLVLGGDGREPISGGAKSETLVRPNLRATCPARLSAFPRDIYFFFGQSVPCHGPCSSPAFSQTFHKI